MIFTYKIDIYKTMKFIQGQGHKVKGQGQKCNNVKKIEKMIKNQRIDKC